MLESGWVAGHKCSYLMEEVLPFRWTEWALQQCCNIVLYVSKLNQIKSNLLKAEGPGGH